MDDAVGHSTEIQNEVELIPYQVQEQPSPAIPSEMTVKEIDIQSIHASVISRDR